MTDDHEPADGGHVHPPHEVSVLSDLAAEPVDQLLGEVRAQDVGEGRLRQHELLVDLVELGLELERQFLTLFSGCDALLVILVERLHEHDRHRPASYVSNVICTNSPFAPLPASAMSTNTRSPTCTSSFAGSITPGDGDDRLV